MSKEKAYLGSIDSRVLATGAKYSDQHYIDPNGKIGGGVCGGEGFTVYWQQGPLTFDKRPNGANLLSLLYSVIRRLEFYQKTDEACEANKKTLELLYDALELQWNAKWENRTKNGVVGI